MNRYGGWNAVLGTSHFETRFGGASWQNRPIALCGARRGTHRAEPKPLIRKITYAGSILTVSAMRYPALTPA